MSVELIFYVMLKRAAGPDGICCHVTE